MIDTQPKCPRAQHCPGHPGHPPPFTPGCHCLGRLWHLHDKQLRYTFGSSFIIALSPFLSFQNALSLRQRPSRIHAERKAGWSAQHNSRSHNLHRCQITDAAVRLLLSVCAVEGLRNGFYQDGTGEHGVYVIPKSDEKVVVYKAQYNMAREVLNRAAAIGAIKLKGAQGQPKQFQQLNLLLLGPTYVALREQTKQDLSALFSALRLKDDVDNVVYNSSMLPKERDDLRFIRTLKKHPLDYLHVLVLDEAHWGINDDGIVARFFQDFHGVITDLTERERPSILVVNVSATCDVLTKVIDQYNVLPGSHRVDWHLLRTAHNEKRFAATRYRAIEDLRLRNDQNPRLLAANAVDRSELVRDEYLVTLKQWIIRLPGTEAGDALDRTWHQKPAYEVLALILPGAAKVDSQGRLLHPTEAVDELSESYANNVEHQLVIVRLDRNDHLEELNDGMQQLFTTASARTKRAVFCPFEIIVIHQASPSIWSQLTDKGQRRYKTMHPNARVSARDFSVLNLKGIPCLILVNDKLSMGERVPTTCMALDVRARYKGTVSKLQNAKSTFIQDVGRCAGYNKPQALIVMAIKDDRKATALAKPPTVRDLTFQNGHALLTRADEAAAKHPEREGGSGIFTKIAEYSILLDAEPQIGKTGVILAMLSILYSEHIVHGRD